MKKFRKVLSIVMAVLMLASVAAFSASAAEADNVVPKGTAIMFDNTSTEWTNVYIYGWAYGFAGEFLPMTQVAGTNLYYYILPEDVTIGSNFCLIVNQNSWAGATQTRDIAYTATTVNTVVPSGTGSPLNYTWAYNAPPVIKYVSATPSKSFVNKLNIVLYTNCVDADYSINGATAITYTDGTNVTIGETAKIGDKITVTLTGYDAGGTAIANATYEYTKVGMTTINATVSGYTGDVYAYLFGGDRIGSAFYLMDKTSTGYTIQFEGAAQVIFTTTNDWATAVKLLPADEPLLAAGSTTAFELTYPTA